MSQSSRIMKAISREGGALSSELNGIAYRYSARIHELRKDGVNISTERLKDGLFRYQLVEGE